jgi:hypothetical protein
MVNVAADDDDAVDDVNYAIANGDNNYADGGYDEEEEEDARFCVVSISGGGDEGEDNDADYGDNDDEEDEKDKENVGKMLK